MSCLNNKHLYLMIITSVLLNTGYTQEDGSFWWLKVLKMGNKTAEVVYENKMDSEKDHVSAVSVKSDDLGNSKDTVMKESLNSMNDENYVQAWSQNVHQNNILLQNSGMTIDNLYNERTTEDEDSSEMSRPEDPSIWFRGEMKTRQSEECHCMTAQNCQILRGAPDTTRDGRIKTCKNVKLEFVCCDINSRTQLHDRVNSPTTVKYTESNELDGNYTIIPNLKSTIPPTTAVPNLLDMNPSGADSGISLTAKTTTESDILSTILYPGSASNYPEQYITTEQNITEIIMPSEPRILNLLHPDFEPYLVNVNYPKATVHPNSVKTETLETINEPNLLNVETTDNNVQPGLSNISSSISFIKGNMTGVGEKLRFPKDYEGNVLKLDISRPETELKFPDSGGKTRFKRTIFKITPKIVTPEYVGSDPEPEEDPYWNVKNSNINPRTAIRNRNNSKSANPSYKFHSNGNSNISEMLTEIPKPGIGTKSPSGVEASYNVWLNSNHNPRLKNPSNKSASVVSTKGLNSYEQNYFDYSDEKNKKPAFTLHELLNNLGAPKSQKPISNRLLSEMVENLAEAYLEKLLNDSGIHETTSNQLDPDFIVFQNFLPWRRQLIAKVKQEIRSLRHGDVRKNYPNVLKSPNKWTRNTTPSYDDISDDQIKQIFAGYGQTAEEETPISEPDDVYDAVYEDYEVEPPTTEFLNQIYPKCGTLDDSSGSQSPWLLKVFVDEDRVELRPEDRAELRAGAPRTLCGGALVHPRAALVAAHCVIGSVDGTAALRTCPGADGGVAQERRARILAHSNYRAGGMHDLALLLWRVPLQMGSGARALCVPPADLAATQGSTRCSSLGLNDRRPVSRTARVVSPLSCGGAKSNARTPRAICADNGDSCDQEFEIEGPLICLTGQRWYITGLFSWRRSCTQPARYTDIAAHQAWLINLLEDNYII